MNYWISVAAMAEVNERGRHAGGIASMWFFFSLAPVSMWNVYVAQRFISFILSPGFHLLLPYLTDFLVSTSYSALCQQ